MDFKDISNWFSWRKQLIPSRSIFPANGFIVDNIAAGFVYFTDSQIAIIDCYVSNPESDAKTRDIALDKITDALILCAVASGHNIIKCDTQKEAIKIRAKKHGFRPIGSYESFILEL